MAHVPYIPFEEADGPLRAEYERLGGADVDNILRIHSLDPPGMRHHVALYGHVMRGPSPLSRVEREMIAVTVSTVNRCFY